MGQIWDYSYHILVHFQLGELCLKWAVRQNVLKSDLKSPEVVPFGTNLTHFEQTLTFLAALHALPQKSPAAQFGTERITFRTVQGSQICAQIRLDWQLYLTNIGLS